MLPGRFHWIYTLFLLPFFLTSLWSAEVTLGINRLLNEPKYQALLKGKRVGLITNSEIKDSSKKWFFIRLEKSYFYV